MKKRGRASKIGALRLFAKQLPSKGAVGSIPTSSAVTEVEVDEALACDANLSGFKSRQSPQGDNDYV